MTHTIDTTERSDPVSIEDEMLANPPDALVNRWNAEAAKAIAEARLYDTETAREGVNVDLLNMQREVVAIERDRELYKREVELTSNEYHRVYNFSGAVGESSTASCIRTLNAWSRMDESRGVGPQPIELAFFSPGGDVLSGLALFDFIQEIRSKGHHVVTSTNGFAASMAGILLQAGDERVMGQQATLLIHEVSFGASGSFGKVEDQVEWVRMLQDHVLQIFADRAQPINPRSTKKFFEKNWLRKDWSIGAPEALKLGLVDAVRPWREFAAPPRVVEAA